MSYAILFVALFVLQTTYIKWAERKNLHDIPNERSSHTSPTPTAGGFVIALGILIWAVYFQLFSTNFLWCLVILAIVGLIDDFKNLPSYLRLAIHIGITGFVVWTMRDGYELTLILIVMIPLAFTAWINAFNFMDGINGISGLYALVTLASFWYINDHIASFTPHALILVSGLGILAFSFYNFRSKAKVFGGDVGSISMGYVLGYLMLTLILITQNILFLLFFAVFAVDSGLTIVDRLLKAENIFKPHRQHLYQYLANQKGHNHLVISSIYCGLQAIINIGLILILAKYSILTGWIYSSTIILILVIAYFGLKKQIVNSELDKLQTDE